MDVTWWQDKHESHNMPHQLMTIEDSSSEHSKWNVEATVGTGSAYAPIQKQPVFGTIKMLHTH